MSNRISDHLGPQDTPISFDQLCVEVRTAMWACLSQGKGPVRINAFPEFTQVAFEESLEREVRSALSQVSKKGTGQQNELQFDASSFVTASISPQLREYADAQHRGPDEYVARVTESVDRLLSNATSRINEAQAKALRKAMKAGNYESIVADEFDYKSVGVLISHAMFESFKFGTSFAVLRRDVANAIQRPDASYGNYRILGGWHLTGSGAADSAEAQIDIEHLAASGAFFTREPLEFGRAEVVAEYGEPNAYMAPNRLAVRPFMYGRANLGALVHVWDAKEHGKLKPHFKSEMTLLAKVGAQRLGDIVHLRQKI